MIDERERDKILIIKCLKWQGSHLSKLLLSAKGYAQSFQVAISPLSRLFNYDLFKSSNSCIISPIVYAYFLRCGHAVNQDFGGLLYVGSNSSYFSNDNKNNNDNNNNDNNNIDKNFDWCSTHACFLKLAFYDYGSYFIWLISTSGGDKTFIYIEWWRPVPIFKNLCGNALFYSFFVGSQFISLNSLAPIWYLGLSFKQKRMHLFWVTGY